MLVYLYLKAPNRKDLFDGPADPGRSDNMIDTVAHLSRLIGQ